MNNHAHLLILSQRLMSIKLALKATAKILNTANYVVIIKERVMANSTHHIN